MIIASWRTFILTAVKNRSKNMTVFSIALLNGNTSGQTFVAVVFVVRDPLVAFVYTLVPELQVVPVNPLKQTSISQPAWTTRISLGVLSGKTLLSVINNLKLSRQRNFTRAIIFDASFSYWGKFHTLYVITFEFGVIPWFFVWLDTKIENNRSITSSTGAF